MAVLRRSAWAIPIGIAMITEITSAMVLSRRVLGSRSATSEATLWLSL